ncbi:MAG: hypothetical protein QOE76_2415 [Frankiales bacterium]|nr:hypothetical protein [Frankiales bacterium]
MIDDDATAGEDSDLPDTAMMTGSEAGDPGDRSGDALPLTESEKALLAALVSGSGQPVEASEETVRAASDDTVLPERKPVRNDDPINPMFREP